MQKYNVFVGFFFKIIDSKIVVKIGPVTDIAVTTDKAPNLTAFKYNNKDKNAPAKLKMMAFFLRSGDRLKNLSLNSNERNLLMIQYIKIAPRQRTKLALTPSSPVAINPFFVKNNPAPSKKIPVSAIKIPLIFQDLFSLILSLENKRIHVMNNRTEIILA